MLTRRELQRKRKENKKRISFHIQHVFIVKPADAFDLNFHSHGDEMILVFVDYVE
jgi:hypothetical protein